MSDSYFKDKFRELLPPLYIVSDESGDLTTFLEVLAPTLDELKGLADRFPEMFDVDQCEERFLPYLADLVGYPLDPTAPAELRRRMIREWVEWNRRRGSIPAIRRDLEAIGWTGRIEETFREMVRLNYRGNLNEMRLAGPVYNNAVYRIVSDAIFVGVRAVIARHHPAGMRVFYWDWVPTICEPGDVEVCSNNRIIVNLQTNINEVFTLNRDRLNGPRHLTRLINSVTTLWVTESQTFWSEVELNCTVVQRRRARHGAWNFTLNSPDQEHPSLLNRQALTNCSDMVDLDPAGEIEPLPHPHHEPWGPTYRPARAEFELEIDTGFPHGHRHVIPLQLNRGRLNQTGFRRIPPQQVWHIPDLMFLPPQY